MSLFKPFEWQVEPFRNKSPVMVLAGSAGGGKSWLCGSKLDAFCRHYPGATAVASRKVREDAVTSIMTFLPETIADHENDPNVTFYKKEGRLVYKHKGAPNSELWMIGMKGGNKSSTGIRSFGKDGSVDIWWMEEAHEHDEADYNEIIGRMRGKAGGWTQIMLSTNPHNRGHWVNMRLLLSDDPRIAVYLSRAEDNPTNPQSYLDGLDAMTGLERKRLREGLWVDGEGQVIDAWLDNFNPAAGYGPGNVTLEADYVPGNGRFVWYVDDGYSGEYDERAKMFTEKSQPRAFLFCQERADGTIVVLGEHLEVQLLADRHIARALDYTRKMGWPDPAYVIYDGASPSLGGHLLRAKLTAHPIRCGIEEGNKELNSWIGPDRNGVRKILVNPRCYFLRHEMGAYVYDKNNQPIDAWDHCISACLIAGTMITTQRGTVPIEQVKVGEMVLTRVGYRKVLYSWQSDPAATTYTVELSNGQQLIGTGNHPVFTHGEFIPLASLSPGDVLQSITDNIYFNRRKTWYTRLSKVSQQLKSHSIRGSSLEDTLNQRTGLTGCILGRTVGSSKRVWRRCTERYTKIIMGLYRTAIMSIIKTKTLLTTVLRIWKQSRPKNILNYMARRNGKVEKRCLSISIGPGYLQSNGTKRKLESHGIKSWVEGLGRIGKKVITYASGAESLTPALKLALSDSALLFAGAPNGELMELTTSRENANGVGKSSLSINTKVPLPAPVRVVRIYENKEKQPVYNIEVEEHPEYYASGVLTHNCKYGVWNKAYGRYRPVTISALDGAGKISEDRVQALQETLDAKFAEAAARIEKQLETMYGG